MGGPFDPPFRGLKAGKLEIGLQSAPTPPPFRRRGLIIKCFCNAELTPRLNFASHLEKGVVLLSLAIWKSHTETLETCSCQWTTNLLERHFSNLPVEVAVSRVVLLLWWQDTKQTTDSLTIAFYGVGCMNPANRPDDVYWCDCMGFLAGVYVKRDSPVLHGLGWP